MNREVGAFREVLSKKTVGVLIGAALPGAMRVAEVDVEIGGELQALVVCELLAAVPGQGATKFSASASGGLVRGADL